MSDTVPNNSNSEDTFYDALVDIPNMSSDVPAESPIIENDVVQSADSDIRRSDRIRKPVDRLNL